MCVFFETDSDFFFFSDVLGNESFAVKMTLFVCCFLFFCFAELFQQLFIIGTAETRQTSRTGSILCARRGAYERK